MKKRYDKSNSSNKKQSGEPRKQGGPSNRPTGGGKPRFGGPGRPYKPRPKRTVKEDDGTIRLNKYIANAGICSRREADEFIKSGLAQVNGKVITEMGYKVQPGDTVKFDGKLIKAEKNVYILLNKPKGFITTTRDERDRRTVMDLIANATTARVFPVGRLDRATTGVLLFTNDGDLTKRLTHPSHSVRKIYHVTLDRPVSHEDMEAVRKGIRLIPEGVAVPDKVSYIDGKPRNEIGLELHIGWNRVVRRIFEKLDYKIERLDRVAFGGLTKKDLKRGDWRKLSQKEVGFLKML